MNGLPGHIGINAVFIAPNMGGADTYVRGLMPELVKQAPATRFTVFSSRAGVEYLMDEPWAADVRFVDHPLLGTPGGRALSEMTLLAWLAHREEVDLLDSVAMTGPLRTTLAHVVTLFDVTWLDEDEPAGKWTYRMWRRIVPRIARAATRVLTISEAAKADITSRLAIPASRIDVAHPGYVAPSDRSGTKEDVLRERFGLGSGEIVLNVSTKKRHKNLMRLVQAMPAVLRIRPNAVLVIPGNRTAHEEELRAAARRLGIAPHVVLLPFVSADDLEGLYRAASCFVFPSVHEGFGMPVLEAMARGVPVAASSAGPLPEVAGDAALLFDPTSVEEIAAATLRLLENGDEARRLVAAGHHRAAQFTWQACAQRTLASFQRAWAEHTR